MIFFSAETLVSAGKLTESLKFYDKCIEKEPNEQQFYKKKVEILFRLKKYEEALEVINKCLELDPKDMFFNHFKGVIELKIKKLLKNLKK